MGLKESLEFALSDVWHFLGTMILMFIPATWRLINVDVTLFGGRIEDLKGVNKNDDN